MKIKNITPFALVLAITECSPVYSILYTDKDQSVDFTQYKAFAWLPDNDKENTFYHNADGK